MGSGAYQELGLAGNCLAKMLQLVCVASDVEVGLGVAAAEADARDVVSQRSLLLRVEAP